MTDNASQASTGSPPASGGETPQSAAPATPSTLVTESPATQGAQPVPTAPATTTNMPAQTALTQPTPEEYTFTPPEGITYAPEFIGSYGAAARELGISRDQAQKMIDRMAPVLMRQQQQQQVANRIAWEKSSREDGEFGGAAMEENINTARRGMNAFASPGLRKMLNETGLGNHPEFIRMFYRVGKSISSDDSFVRGVAPASSAQDIADRMYPNESLKR